MPLPSSSPSPPRHSPPWLTRCGSRCSRCGRATTSPPPAWYSGLTGLTSTAGLMIRLWPARGREKLSNRWPFPLLVITGRYGYQTSTAFSRRQQPGGAVERGDARVHLLRGRHRTCWELLGLRGGGLLDLLNTAVARPAHRAALAPSPWARPALSPGPSRDQYHRPPARCGPVRGVTRRMLRRKMGMSARQITVRPDARPDRVIAARTHSV